MNRYNSYYLILLIIFSGFISADNPKRSPRNYFQGETIEYRVHYGFINAGEAKIEVDDKLYRVNDKICYKAQVYGRSSGTFDMALRVRDTWGSYIDTNLLSPERTYRNIEEGKYRLKEVANFDYKKNAVVVERENPKEKKAPKNIKEYKIPLDVQDIVSGYYFLRSIDFNKHKVGDTIAVNAFFEDQVYNFKVKFMGRNQIECKFGNIKALKLVPIMPNNELFEGGNSIRLFLSDDKNKIPLKIEADMFVGAVEVDLKSFKNLKYPLCFSKD